MANGSKNSWYFLEPDEDTDTEFAICRWLLKCAMVFVRNPLLVIYTLLGALCSMLIVN